MRHQHGWPVAGFFEPAHVAFAEAMHQLLPSLTLEELLAAALASRAVETGSACADLNCLPYEFEVEGEKHKIQWPERLSWRQALLDSALFAKPGQIEEKPLFFDGHSRVYLERYHAYEHTLASFVATCLASHEELDLVWAQSVLAMLFPSRNGIDMQAVAAALALRSRLTIVSGGPGTGKTTVVTRLLAMLIAWQRKHDLANPRIALLAPTGKAATRLAEAIRGQKQTLPNALKWVCDAIPDEASTIHRYLGWQPYAPTEYFHNEHHPTAADIVVVDECSMVDLANLAKLVKALKANSKLILLGDHHQLASVEVGTVLGDLVREERDWTCSQETANYLAKVLALETKHRPRTQNRRGIWDHVVVLQKSFRFDNTKSLGRFAASIRSGSPSSMNELKLANDGHITQFENGYADQVAFSQQVISGFESYLRAGDPERLLRHFEDFRVLCAHRQGVDGAEQVNVAIERILEEAGLLSPHSIWYSGRPIMITRNDYQLGLFNGDMGVCFKQENGDMAVAFPPSSGNEIRWFSPFQLPPCETAFALTIHKSQGSEYERVALVLPERDSRVMTRELIYTGLTRARSQVAIFASSASLAAALARRVDRASGLGQQFWTPMQSMLEGEQLNLFVDN